MLKMSSQYYQKDGVCSCEIVGAIALAALHDLHVNNFAFDGFPQISVFDAPENKIKVILALNKHNGITISTEFELDQTTAFNAAKLFQKKHIYDQALIKPVQIAIAELERKYNHNTI